MNKIFFIDKPVNISSFDVVYKVKKKFHESKGGHCGTLDPFASGLMIVLLGEATKLSNYLLDKNKTYVAELKLGEKTSTSDTEGEIIETQEVRDLSEEEIIDALNSFLGDSYQVPPMFSALKFNGRKLYELAREGIDVEREPRKINISDIKLLSYKNNVLEFEVSCSKGTYIRTLGEDIATKLNTIGHLINLRRIKVDDYSIDRACKIEDVNNEAGFYIRDIWQYKKIIVDDKTEIDVKNGKHIKLDCDDELVLLLNKNNKELAIYSKCEDGYKTERGFNINDY